MKISKALYPLLLSGAVFLSRPVASTAQDNGRYAIRSSIPNQHVTSFAQDKAGYMWIATAKGLCRYNGYEYFHYYQSPDNPSSIPSDFVTSLYIDDKQRLWVATNTGLCRYNSETDDFTRIGYGTSQNKPSSELGMVEFGNDLFTYGSGGLKKLNAGGDSLGYVASTSSHIVRTAVEDDLGRLWLGTDMGQGILCLDKDLSVERHIEVEPSLTITACFKTRSGRLWFGTNKGILTVDPSTGSMSVEGNLTSRHAGILSQLYITNISRINASEIAIATENRGLFIYTPATGELSPYARQENLPGDGSRHITCLYSDAGHNLWLGTFDKGYFIKQSVPKKFNDDILLNSAFGGRFVTRICEDAAGDLWVGTRYDGFAHYSMKTGRITRYDRSNFEPLGRANSDMIHSLYIDPAGNLWVGYDKYLIWCRLRGNAIISHKTYETAPHIVSIAADDSRRIWAGSSSGGVTIYDIDHRSEPFALPMEDGRDNVTSIIKLRSGEMMFSVYGRGVFIADPHTLEIRALAAGPGSSDMPDGVIFLCEDRNSHIWMGTYGRGLIRYDAQNERCTEFTPADGLCSNDVLAVAGDTTGCIWMSTSYGVSKFDPASATFSNYYEHNGTGGNQFHEKSLLRSSSGKFYFGGNHGITYFDPHAISSAYRAIPVALEGLKIMNLDEKPGEKGGVLPKHISQVGGIMLNHRQNIFSIDYSAINFDSPRNIRYAYMLKPFDKDWNYVNDYRRATYSNLPPGNYTFEVKAQNPEGIWNEIPTTFGIKIKVAPWLTTAAISGYVLLALLAIGAGSVIYVRIKLDKERIALIEKEREYDNRMNELKIRFFTNISHELRTPLAMIYGPVKKLMDGGNDPETIKRLLRLVNYNVETLLSLADQQIDFVKLESDTLELSVSAVDAAAIAGKLMESYSFYANEKNIDMKLVAPGTLPVMADADKINKILSNLLSNALKYTPDNGHVTIELTTEDDPQNNPGSAKHIGRILTIRVIDDGIGMKTEEMERLFGRYQRFAGRNYKDRAMSGKGIGLHYVRQLVEKHKGGITAAPGNTGGMVFCVTIPIDKDAYSPDEIKAGSAKPDTAGREAVNGRQTATVQPLPPDKSDRRQPRDRNTVMIVEDNRELRAFIGSLFQDRYNITEASNGKEGYAKCREGHVDLIISDVLMPGMDGFELCSKIKNDPGLCHIPFIILTAKTMDSHRIEGYTQGADAYVSKPFNPRLLTAIVENTFSNIEKRKSSILRTREYKNADQGTVRPNGGDAALNPMDKRFLEKLYTYMDKDLSNSTLNVNSMGKELAFSRTSFYRKIKALTGESPNGFLRIYRLNKAAELLKRNEFSINEIVDMTGFGTHSHFSHCFKKRFGISPKDYGKK